MKPRIEKKLSKRLVQIAPEMFKDAWKDKESHIYCMGGGLDYWGEALETYTAWEWLINNYEWLGDFTTYPEGHELEGYPVISKFKATTRNLLKLAANEA
jgi:hypothetical protein